MSHKGAHIVVRGRVQGVGFRYYCRQRADLRNLTGWVRNRADGSVECVAVGAEADILHFQEDLKKGPQAAFVAETELDWSESSTEFTTFEIRM